ncbi:copper chaperone PCu(A)C [Sphingomicrobium sp. XHP0239]|uniref:copper chaperone PCu(A)C n=1 Tax=Sphingomicrobium maritimum TaxID=3133972 RepID=UPI0031CC48AD
MNSHLRHFVALPLALLIASCAPPADDGGDTVRIDDAWARATAPGQTGAAAYFTIVNDSDEDVRLLAASTDIGMASLHRTVIEDGVASMRPIVGGLGVQAGSSARLEPQGDHVMIMGLSAPLEAGDRFDLLLDFETGDDRTVTVEVVEAGAR